MRDVGNLIGGVTVGIPGAFAYGSGISSVKGVEYIELNPELGEYFGSGNRVLAEIV